MSEAKRRKDSSRAALNKCWAEDIEWDLIPHTLREGCAQIGKALSVPATSVLAGLLILISYFSSHAVVNPFGTDWFEPMLAWVVIVMPTGAGKSTLFKFLKEILGKVRERIEGIERKDGNGKVADWVVEEASMEKMGSMMCENSNKLLGIYDELTHFLTQINIYRNRGLSDTHDLAMFLQLYNGLPWSRKTVGGECNFAMDITSLTVGGFTQPTTATNIMVVPGNAEKGLSQRFLWVCPRPVFLEYDSLGRVDEAFHNKVVDLLFMLALKQQKSPQKTKEFYLTDVAKDTFRDAFNKIQENLKGISGADDLLSGMLSKSKGQILRFTGCLHCMFLVDEIQDAESPEKYEIPSVVTDAAVRAAINFVETCTNHTLYLCGRQGSKEEVSSVLSEVGKSDEQPQEQLPVNAASNPEGYMLLIPGKRLYITALNERKKFRDMGNKQGAVDAINALERAGLGIVITNKAQGTSKQYTFVKRSIEEGTEADLAVILARFGVSLRQYKKSLMEDELLPTRASSKRKHSSPAENSLCEESTGHAADKDSKQPCDTKSPRRSPRLACYKTPDAQPEQTTSKIVPRSLEADFNK